MKLMRTKIILILLLFASIQVNCQSINDEILQYDYFNHTYKYLDENFKIKIAPKEFQLLMEKYKYFPDRIRTCRDSLGVVLMGEFGDWHKARIAKQRILFSELRASYYLWTTEAEIKKMIEHYKFRHVYHFYEYFRYKEVDWDEKMKNYMSELRHKVLKSTGNKTVLNMTNKDFMSYALLNNPKRIKDYEVMKSKREKGDVSCGKKDCCQSKKK